MKRDYIKPIMDVHSVAVKSNLLGGSNESVTIKTSETPSNEINESKDRGWSEDLWE